MSPPASVVVVGGGLAGASAALALRDEGYEGRIILICGEEHPPYNRPPLSKAVVRGEVAPERTHLRPPHVWESKDIELVLGTRAAALDPGAHRLTLDDDSELRYDKLLLATGGRPRQLALPAWPDGVHVLRTIDDAVAIREVLSQRRSLAVVGAGFIGAELAASARAVEAEVTVFEAAPLPLAHILPPALGEVYARLHRARGVDLRTGAIITGLERDGSSVRIVDGSGNSFVADAVAVAIGLDVDVELGLRAGLHVDNGIVVDELCRTSAPDVFAAGDVANHPNRILGRRLRVEHFQHAQHQGAAAARSMLGIGEPFAEVPWVWSDQYDVRLEVTGVPRPSDEIVLRGDAESLEFIALLVRDGSLAAAIALNRSADVRAVRKLIAQGVTPPREQLVDEDLPLRELVPSAASSAS